MDKIIKNILKIIEDNGFEAYLVGGYVRDNLLGISSYDVDICTNALPKDLHKMFPKNNNSNEYGGFNIKIKKYNIDITTYRKEVKYNGRFPKVEYINSLEEDLLRRDFTINAICMDKNDKIIDYLNGIDDLNNQTIRMIGNISDKLIDDPLRILRAIRIATITNFDIENNLYKEINNNYQLVSNLSNYRIKQELNKILLSKNFMKGLKYLKELNILKLLNIDFKDIVYVNDLCGMWAQLKFTNTSLFTKQELNNIIWVRNIIKNGFIDNKILFEYGLYNSLVAADILNIDRKIINNMYNKLVIKDEKELNITNREIIDLLNLKPSKRIKDIRNDLIDKVINKEIKNNKKDIIKYLMR